MTFEDHVRHHVHPDGGFDLSAAESAYAEELMESDVALETLARGKAQSERRKYEAKVRDHLKKQFAQLTFDGLDVEALVPLGDDVVVPLGEMNEPRIRTRQDLRTDGHLNELRAFDAEMTFWRQALQLMPSGGTIGDLA